MFDAYFDAKELALALRASATAAHRTIDRLIEDEATIAALRSVIISAARRSNMSQPGSPEAEEHADLAAAAETIDPSKAKSHVAVLGWHESAADALVRALRKGCRPEDADALRQSVSDFVAAVDAALRSAEKAMANNQHAVEALCAAWEKVVRRSGP